MSAKTTSPTVLFVREVPWETHFPISTRVLAGKFAADGWQVIWLTTPLMPWQGVRPGSHTGAFLQQHRSGGIRYEGGQVFAYTPRTLGPFSRRAPLNQPALARAMWGACIPGIRQVLRRAGLPDPDVLILGHWAAGGIRRLFPGVPAIFHVTDHYEGYPAVPPEACRVLQRENYRSADHIIVTAPSLKERLVEAYAAPAEKISVITHGMHAERYADTPPEPAALRSIPRPRVVALGNTSKLDYPALRQAAQAMPQVAFVVLGPPCGELDAAAAEHANIHALGAVDPADVPAHLMACDVGLILLGERYRGAGVDMAPMKLFEYAAAGLPVVSTPLPVYEALNAPVLCAQTAAQVQQAIQTALESHAAQAEKMRAFAQAHTWDSKYQAMRQIVQMLTGGTAR